MYEAIDIKKVN